MTLAAPATIPACAYIQALRIEEAKQILETSDMAIEAVGREVGYEDAASFHRLFRRYAGLGPGEYRRKLQPPDVVRSANPDLQKKHAPFQRR